MFRKGVVFFSIIIILLCAIFHPISEAEIQIFENSFAEEKNEKGATSISESIRITNMQVNVLVSSNNLDKDDNHPKIARKGETVVIAYEKEEESETKTIRIAYTEDKGQTWVPKFTFYSAAFSDGSSMLQSPDIKYAPDADEFFLTMIDPLAEIKNFNLVWIPGDIATAEDTKWWSTSLSIDAGDKNTNFRESNYEQAACTYVYQWFLGLHTFDIPAKQWHGDLIKTLSLAYLYHDKELDEVLWPKDYQSGWVPDGFINAYYYDGQYVLQTAPSYKPEMATGTNRIFLVTEHYNEDANKSQIVYKATITDVDVLFGTRGGGPKNMDKYADIEVWPWQQYLLEGIDPDISANENNVYVVCSSRKTAWDNDIICAYSSDDGDSWNYSYVANESYIDEMYPAVYATDTDVYCCYVKSGNLYLVISKDEGNTWSEPFRINDVDGTVVEEPGTMDLIDTGVVWTDSRNENKDIFFNKFGPEINISVSGGFGLSIEICNEGNTVSYPVNWSITIDGPLVFIGKSQSGYISEVKPGQCITIESMTIIGLGQVNITIQIGDITVSRTGFLLGPFVIFK
jgi:hypothetical protein